MKNPLGLPDTSSAFGQSRWLEQICRKILTRKLSQIRAGFIELSSEDNRETFGDPSAPAHLRAHVRIRRARAYARMTLGGTIGVGESYVDHDWETDDLVSLIRIFVVNRSANDALDSGWGALAAPVQKLLHSLRDNSLRGSRQNIRAHYDLGNDFFSLFLGETWMYSSGIYLSAESTLDQAQYEKNDRICRKLALGPSDHVLEIGTGWGGFAIHAALHYGARVTTTTLSREQAKLARTRIEAAGLSARIEVLEKDYRDLEGTYDKLVSIEMIEAVGENHVDGYLAKCASLVKPDGAVIIQAILIRDQFYEQAARSVDFIQTHVFPGAFIPSVGRILQSTSQTDLQLIHLDDIGNDYARTIADWTARLDGNWAAITQQGYPESLYRLWKYYFGYCEGGFRERQISAAQLMFSRPGFRGATQWKGTV